MVTVETIQNINYVIALGTVFGILASIVLLLDLYTKQYAKIFVNRFGTFSALAVTFFAVTLTLVYSEIFGVIPCGFCWLERVMLYPQVLMIVGALYIKDKMMMPVYGIIFSALGFCISMYHHYIQMGGSQFVKCPAAGAGADCAKRIIFEFGFVTFPLMAGVLFAFLIVLYLYMLRAHSQTV